MRKKLLICGKSEIIEKVRIAMFENTAIPGESLWIAPVPGEEGVGLWYNDYEERTVIVSPDYYSGFAVGYYCALSERP